MIRVLHVTDTHVVGTEETTDPPETFAGSIARIQGRTTTESLRLVLEAVVASGFRPDVLLHTGDATDDGEAGSYDVLRDVLAVAGTPVTIAVPGNHDRAEDLAATFGNDPRPVRTVDLGPWQIVAVDTAEFARQHGVVEPDVLVSLDAALTAAPGHVLIGLHHPPVAICPDPSCRLEPADQVLAVLARHPNVRIVAAGHLHVTDETERGGLTQLLSPSTGIQLRHQHPLRDHNGAPTPIGARLIELDDDGTFTTELRWV